MDLKNIGIISLGVVIAALLMSVLLVPIVSDATSAERTIENTGMPYAEAGGDHVIVITADGITFDGDAVDMTMFPGDFQTYTLVYGEESFIRWGAANIIIVSDSDGLHSFNVSTNTITITISDNTAVVSTTGSATTYSIDDVMFYMSPSGGDYVLAVNPYVNDEMVVYAAGDTYYTASGRPAALRIWTIWTGELDEITVVSCGTNSSGYTALTVSEITVDLANIETNLYRYNSVVFDYTATYTDAQEQTTDVPLTATYTYFLAPAEVSYDNSSYIGSAAAMLAIVPLLVTVGIIMAAVGIFVSRRE